jgi:hypothetical protein
MPGLHMRSECHTAADVEAQFQETPNTIGQGSAACGASPAPTGCAANGTNNERTEK